VGPWAGIHGLLIDALLSLRVVLADGQVLELSKKSNPDLFWAFRGAGANFGVVVSAKYQLQEQVNNGNILVTDFLVPAELNGTYFELLKSYEENQPPNLSFVSFIGFNATTQTVCVMTQPSRRCTRLT
jgi:FAD/FMN-containing dehydrogenase